MSVRFLSDSVVTELVHGSIRSDDGAAVLDIMGIDFRGNDCPFPAIGTLIESNPQALRDAAIAIWELARRSEQAKELARHAEPDAVSAEYAIRARIGAVPTPGDTR